MEHLSLPYDLASRRLFGVPVVATVLEAAGVGHVLATDAVVVDTDTGHRGAVVGVLQRRRLQQEPDPCPLRGPVRDLGAVSAGRRLLRLDGLEMPVGGLSSSRFSATPPDPRDSTIDEVRVEMSSLDESTHSGRPNGPLCSP